MKRAVLGLGSNLGDREKNLQEVIQAFQRLPKTQVLSISRFYRTPPVEVTTEQGEYLNGCIQILTDFSPRALLGICLGIEAALGRVRKEYHGERIIDIDLLLYEDEKSDDEELTLPHPRMLNRAFVLLPLKDLFPEGEALGLNFVQKLNEVDSTGISVFEKP